MKKKYLAVFLFFPALYFVALYFKIPLLELSAKPVPVLLLIVISKPVTRYNRSLLTGFIFSLLGDVFLTHYIDFFLPGLVSFLLAHIFYIRAFFLKSRDPGLKESLVFFSWGAVIFLFLRPHLGEMIIPVFFYMLVIVTMVWRSFLQRRVSAASGYAFYGALLFFLSDTLLACNLFYYNFTGADISVMLTYWSAQLLIYKSIDK